MFGKRRVNAAYGVAGSQRQQQQSSDSSNHTLNSCSNNRKAGLKNDVSMVNSAIEEHKKVVEEATVAVATENAVMGSAETVPPSVNSQRAVDAATAVTTSVAITHTPSMFGGAVGALNTSRHSSSDSADISRLDSHLTHMVDSNGGTGVRNALISNSLNLLSPPPLSGVQNCKQIFLSAIALSLLRSCSLVLFSKLCLFTTVLVFHFFTKFATKLMNFQKVFKTIPFLS